MASLLNEIRSLSEEDLQAAVSEAAGAAAPSKKKAAPRAKKLAKDSPISRIAKVVKQDRGLSDYDGQVWLRSALQQDGVDADLIPAISSSGTLESWLEVLLKSVRSSVVYDLATSG